MSKLKAEIYIGAAENGGYPPAMAERLQRSLMEDVVRYTTQNDRGAHGWIMPDFPVYDHAAAELSRGKMFALFGRPLYGGE